MAASIIFSLLITFILNYVNAFGHLSHLDLESYSDPRFLNSDYQFKGLGLFHPSSKSFESHASLSEAKKGFNDEHLVSEQGASGEEVAKHGSGKFKGQGTAKDEQGESGYSYDINGVKKEDVDGKGYYGNKHFGSEEKSGEEDSTKQGHRKGHKIKGFSNSHHNDESGKSEEYYDDEHDEADNEGFAANSGASDESAASAFKGGHKDAGFKTDEIKKGVVFDKGEAKKKFHGSEGHFGETNFGEAAESFGSHKLLGEGKLSEFKEDSDFIKEYPNYDF